MTSQAGDAPGLIFTPPSSEMGYQVAELIKNCPPLDTNSTYCNLLQCHHFAETSCAVLQDEKLVGFISGYLVPKHDGEADTLFIWQVAVDSSQRGQNLGMRMMMHILSRAACNNVHYLETTVTDDNAASTRMFQKLADGLETEMQNSVLFDRDIHFNGQHDSENLFRIGPFQQPQSS